MRGIFMIKKGFSTLFGQISQKKAELSVKGDI